MRQLKAVELGADFLDERLPGWRNEIDPETLALESSCDCVLGQLFGDYERGMSLLGVDYGQSRVLGFRRGRTTYDRLTEAWRCLVTS